MKTENKKKLIGATKVVASVTLVALLIGAAAPFIGLRFAAGTIPSGSMLKTSGTGGSVVVATASDLAVTDTAENFTTDDVEAALAELATNIAAKLDANGGTTSGVLTIGDGLAVSPAAITITEASPDTGVIDVGELLNTATIDEDTTFSFSATPDTGRRFGLRVTGDATARTVTIPSSYSEAAGSNITSFVVPANGIVTVLWEKTATGYAIYGDPTTLTVPVGGTGLTSTTAYAILAGGTTSTGALQQVSGVGTSGQVLTSNGAGALPSWQAASGNGADWMGGYQLYFSGTPATGTTQAGISVTEGVISGTVAAVAPSAGVPKHLTYTSAATTDEAAGVRSSADLTDFAGFVRWDALVSISTTSNVRFVAGVSDTSVGSHTADDPAYNQALFRFSTAASDTNWMACSNDGASGGTITDTGVAVTTGFFWLAIEKNASGHYLFYINASLVATHTTNLPTSTAMLRSTSYLRTLADSAAAVKFVQRRVMTKPW